MHFPPPKGGRPPTVTLFSRRRHEACTPIEVRTWQHVEPRPCQGVQCHETGRLTGSSPWIAGAAPLTVSEPGARLWVGLKNGDDQGTRFAVRTELYVSPSRPREAHRLGCRGRGLVRHLRALRGDTILVGAPQFLGDGKALLYRGRSLP